MRGRLRDSVVRVAMLATLAGAAVAAAGVYFLPRTPLALAAAVLGGLLVAWLIATAFARRIALPVERLASSAVSMNAGDRGRTASTEGLPREGRLVAEALNTLASEVSGASDQLRAEERRKSQFISDVSHELRTPLTAIRGAAETLLDGGVSAEDQERFLSTIATESERLTRLANDLLTLQRIEGATGELPLRRIDLRQAADRTAALFEPIMEEREVELVVSGSAPLVLGDLDRLQQVVANLVDNASRAVGPGGHVRVELSEGDGGTSVLTVSDDGPGVAEADLGRLFDRFYKADSSRARSGGSGLGLAIVRAIVGAHGGKITAENLEPRGSRFTVSLPSLPEQ